MAALTFLSLLVPALTALVAGLVIHSFIIGVNVSDWWRGRSVTPVDHIVTSLEISRICAQCVNTLYFIIVTFRLRNPYSRIILAILDALYGFFVYANVWMTSLLSIVLCLKISNLHTRLFLYLRRMISHRTGRLIVAPVILSTLYFSLSLWMTLTAMTNGGTHNNTMERHFLDCTFFNSLYTFTIGTIVPLILYSISSVLLFVSLYHHTTRMKMSSNLSINLETYYSVMKLVSFTFIYNTVFFTGHIVCILYYYMNCMSLPWLYVTMDFLPALHSSYLIYRTAKLRSQMSKVLQHVMDFLFQRKNAETRENLETVAQ
ncbi:hypothetical protein GDO81_025892 [Engystomops pustulosus]|uniref:Taste receptor type 2 n=1 Tax=Engystomops pustulosus TaxID=76066 RepID=A0AAV6ZQL5_ENGPU|nr:hypothetical protein GDO81_025892 [Engystomops pustulosus]